MIGLDILGDKPPAYVNELSEGDRTFRKGQRVRYARPHWIGDSREGVISTLWRDKFGTWASVRKADESATPERLADLTVLDGGTGQKLAATAIAIKSCGAVGDPYAWLLLSLFCLLLVLIAVGVTEYRRLIDIIKETRRKS